MGQGVVLRENYPCGGITTAVSQLAYQQEVGLCQGGGNTL